MSLRVLYIGNDYWREAGQRGFLFYTRFYNGLIRNGHFVHYFSGPNEARQTAPLGIRRLGVTSASKRLVEIAGNIRPQLIVVSYMSKYMEAIREIKEKYPDTRVAYLSVDSLFSQTNMGNLRAAAEVADAIFVTTGGDILRELSRQSVPFYFYPNVVDASIDTGKSFALERPSYDLCCFMNGAHNLEEDQRHRIHLAQAAAAVLDPQRVYYGGFDNKPPLHGLDYFATIANSAMSLNLSRIMYEGVLSRPEERCMYSSDRLAHITGNGSLAIIESGFNLESLYTKDEAVYFETREDLCDKVSYYARNTAERQRIARKGWEKAHRAFNEQVVMRYVVERSMGMTLSGDYEWPLS